MCFMTQDALRHCGQTSSAAASPLRVKSIASFPKSENESTKRCAASGWTFSNLGLEPWLSGWRTPRFGSYVLYRPANLPVLIPQTLSAFASSMLKGHCLERDREIHLLWPLKLSSADLITLIPISKLSERDGQLKKLCLSQWATIPIWVLPFYKWEWRSRESGKPQNLLLHRFLSLKATICFRGSTEGLQMVGDVTAEGFLMHFLCVWCSLNWRMSGNRKEISF